MAQETGYNFTFLSAVDSRRRGPRKPTPWLWPDYLPPGAIGIFDGDPGLGKSFVTCDLAARVSVGANWPGGAKGGRPAGTIMLAAEDDRETLVDRLHASGADLTKVGILSDVMGEIPSLPRDIPIIEELVVKHKVKLVIIDPIMVFLGVDSNRDQSVRKAVAPLAAMAQRTGCTVIMVRHLIKSGGRNAKHGGAGSMGLIGQCRFGYMFGADADDPNRRIVATVKMNLAPSPPSLAYRLSSGRAVWEDKPVEIDADDLMMNRRVDTAERNERQEAVDFLRGYLSDQGGIAWPVDILKEGRESGYTQSQLRTAKKKLKVRSRKVRNSWLWCLPEHDPHTRLHVVG